MTEPAESAEIIPLWRARPRAKLAPALADFLDSLSIYPYGEELLRNFGRVEKLGDPACAYLGLVDRYYLMVALLNRKDMLAHGPKGNKWLYERCREVEAQPDDCLDLWSRYHYKSSIITQAGVIQEVLRDPEMTVGIFSHTKAIAKHFLSQIKLELEQNARLQRLYPHVLYEEPAKESPRWGLDSGILCKRRGNPPEGTIEAWGLVDGQPVGKHFKLRVYDDVWTRENVTTPEQITKTVEARELSDNLGVRGGREWNIGTRYSFADGYGRMLDSGLYKARIYPATDDGTINGNPVFLSPEEWEDKKKRQPSQVAAQLLQNPLAGHERMFDPAWFKSYWTRPRTLNVYIMGDPSKGMPSRRSDRTAIVVIGVDAASNKYLLDGYRSRMKLPGRWTALKALHRKWSRAPGVLSVSTGWEQYGLVTDIEYFERQQLEDGYSFPIEQLATPRDHNRSKEDRVERLVPDIRDSRFFFPAVAWRGGEPCEWTVVSDRISFKPLKKEPNEWSRMEDANEAYRIVQPIKRADEENKIYDLTEAMMEELCPFPFGTHDDLVDAASRIYDMEPVPPMIFDQGDIEPDVFPDT